MNRSKLLYIGSICLLVLITVTATTYVCSLMIEKSAPVTNPITIDYDTEALKEAHRDAVGTIDSTPSLQYEKEKIAEICDKIINREVIPDSYYGFLVGDDKLIEDIKFHNKLTAEFCEYFTHKATGIIIAILELNNDDGSPMTSYAKDCANLSDENRELIARISKHCLYENANELLRSDAKLSLYIAAEGGSSAGLWPSLIHVEISEGGANEIVGLSDYFDLEKRLVTELVDIINAR